MALLRRFVRMCLSGLVSVSVVTGCQQKMADQPSYRPLEKSTFYPHDRSARPIVSGTVARGHLRTDFHLYRGRRRGLYDFSHAVGTIGGVIGPYPVTSLGFALEGSPYVNTYPMDVTVEFVQRGKSRYGIYCVMCHGQSGHGDGIVVKRGYAKAPSYHVPRLRQARLGYLFDVITNGHGAMPAYDYLVPVKDRWAIIAYVRALQQSQYAKLDSLPPRTQRTFREKVK